LCDFPTVTTSFARVGRNLLSRRHLRATSQGVAVVQRWGINFEGGGCEASPCQLYPGGRHGWNSPAKLQQFLNPFAAACPLLPLRCVFLQKLKNKCHHGGEVAPPTPPNGNGHAGLVSFPASENKLDVPPLKTPIGAMLAR
jgi:hypothetical protein